MAKITSGAILEKTERMGRVIRCCAARRAKCVSAKQQKKLHYEKKNSDVVHLFYYSGVKTEHLQTNKATLKLFNQQLVKVKSQRAALMILNMTFQLILG